MNKNTFLKLDVIGQILSKPTEQMETAGFSDKDIMAIKAVACYEGVNENGALFEREDLERAAQSLKGKPVRILFDGQNPTGHGYNKKTRRFSNLVANIGFIHSAYGSENKETGRYEVIVEMIVWQKYYPEIASRLRQLHRNGELKFSIEAQRDFKITPEGYRRCFNILFTGIAVVKSPAFDEARSLMVAEIINQGGTHMEEMKVLLESMKDKIGFEIAEQFKTHLGALNSKIEKLEGKLETAETENTNLKTQNTELKGDIKTLEADRDKYKEVVETAQKEKLGSERLKKLSKYGKTEKTAQELAELDKETFVDLLAEMVESYKPDEVAEKDETVGAYFDSVKKEKTDRKSKLLSLCEGFLK